MRLNKYIASCGASSRRGADDLITSGRITVNGEAPTSIGQDIDEKADVVYLDGNQIKPEENYLYIMLNKPPSVLSTCSDDRGRRTVLDLLDGVTERVFPVGRLDYDTKGLLLLTNDGDFAYKCTHPKYELAKKYHAVVKGILNDKAIETLSGSISIDGHKTSGAKIEILNRSAKRTELFVTIHEGRNRHIKKLFELAGCKVANLARISIGSLELGSLPEGKWRSLSKSEINNLIDEKSF